ncbi:MAG TPA: hypothetical protein VG742_21375 [Dongiaceae bacterium]|nr:hypothetical protein [Dongiaceae bacterium]
MKKTLRERIAALAAMNVPALREECHRRNKTTAVWPVLQLRNGHRRGRGTHSIKASKSA